MNERKRDSALRRLAIILSHRLLLSLLLLTIQIGAVVWVILVGAQYFVRFYFACIALSLLVVLYIVNKQGHPDYKIVWILAILTFPLFGGMFYLVFGGNSPTKRSLKRMEGLENLSSTALDTGEPPIEKMLCTSPGAMNQSRYLYRTSACPPYENTATEYLPTGEIYFQRLLEELKRAEHYIFLQYFIIKEGVMWDAILDVLIRKAQKGVDVRVLYDDLGCLSTLPRGYGNQLQRCGIQCAVFNPLKPLVSLRLNNRDHRKICVIDGHTAFTGGLNLSDEYINQWHRFGHWLDSGILLRGEAVWTFTAIFLASWDYNTGQEEELSPYRPRYHMAENFASDGVVQPYTSNPGSESVGAGVYLHLITRARKYLYITTPYLVIDHAMTQALCDAARSGVDVRIMTPHIPDKRYVFELTRAHYVPLLEAGVRIFEYTPGFVHAKTFAVDDEFGVVGTVNLDYRSLYLNYECGVWMYRSQAVGQIRDSFLSVQRECEEVALEQATRLDWFKRLYRSILRMFAPLM
jgi:cardiolipin synthase